MSHLKKEVNRYKSEWMTKGLTEDKIWIDYGTTMLS